MQFAGDVCCGISIYLCFPPSGHFGDVFYGRLTVPGRIPRFVSIEVLPEMTTEQNRLLFLTKADVSRRFDSVNVIYTEGIVTASSPHMIVSEYAPHGPLLGILRVCIIQFQSHYIVFVMCAIASESDLYTFSCYVSFP